MKAKTLNYRQNNIKIHLIFRSSQLHTNYDWSS